MRILLVQTPNIIGSFLNLPGKEIPLSLLYLASYLKSKGYKDVEVLDIDFLDSIEPHLENKLRNFMPDVVGITSYTTNIAIAADIAKKVKETLADVITVIGGFHASALPERTLSEFVHFDYLVFGEGEVTLYEFMESLSQNRKPTGVAGVAFRNGERIEKGTFRPYIEDLDSLPFPDRGLVPIRKYVPDPGNYFRLPSSAILFSRGCPFRCTYCSKSVFLHRLRYRSADNFLDEVEDCAKKFRIYDFRLEDEGPTANPKKLRQLCEKILERGLKISWNCFSRVDTVDGELLTLMKRAGCYHITYGIESADSQTLMRINKGIDLNRAGEIVQQTKKLGIECKVNFIFGFPWETVKDINKTIRYAMRISPDLVSFNIFKPLPGSQLYSEMEKRGEIKHTKWEDYFVTSEALLFDAPFTEAEIRKLIRRAFFLFYFRPRFIIQRLRRFFRYPKRELVTVSRGIFILFKEVWRMVVKKLSFAGGL